MKRSIVRLVSLLGVSFATLATSVIADHHLTASKEHEAMNHEVGVWDAEVSVWEKPDAEPMKSKAVETNEMLGKMWLMSEFEGEFGGEKFSGRSALGWDPIKKKYFGGWVDTMSPFMTSMEGEYDEASETLTMMAEGVDHMTGKPMKMKMVTRYTGDDEKTFEIHKPVEGKEGEWWKAMEAKYTRRK